MKRIISVILCLALCTFCFVGCEADESYNKEALDYLDSALAVVSDDDVESVIRSGKDLFAGYFDADVLAEKEKQYGYELYFAGLYSQKALTRYVSINKIVEYYGVKGANRAKYQLQRYTYDSESIFSRPAMLAYALFAGEPFDQMLYDENRIIENADETVTVFRNFVECGGGDKLFVLSGKKYKVISLKDGEFFGEEKVNVNQMAFSETGNKVFLRFIGSGYDSQALIDIDADTVKLSPVKPLIREALSAQNHNVLSADNHFAIPASVSLYGWDGETVLLNFSFIGNQNESITGRAAVSLAENGETVLESLSEIITVK